MPPLEFPSRQSSTDFSVDAFQKGKNKVPFRIKLTAEQYSNNASSRANGGDPLFEVILPPPTSGLSNSIMNAYNQAPAKEEARLLKIFSGEGKSLFRDIVNLIGKQFQDGLSNYAGMDYGRIPADMSESTYGGSDKREFEFTWELMALSKEDSRLIMEIADGLTSYSLPGARASSDRAQAPPMWRIQALSNTGESPAGITKILLGSPKACVLTNCAITRDMSYLYSNPDSYPTPLSINLSVKFQEIEPVYGQDGNIRSRAEVRTGGGWFSV